MPVNNPSLEFHDAQPSRKARVGIAVPMHMQAELPKNCIAGIAWDLLGTPDREPLLLSEGVETALYVWGAMGKGALASLVISNTALASKTDKSRVATKKIPDSWQHRPSCLRDV